MTDRELAQAIGVNVWAARERAGLSQEELAERAGIRQSHISRVEAGKHMPSLKTLNRLAAALDIPLASLFQ